MNLNDLPDEVLCQIFDHLDLYELKLASLVCSRWAELTFSGQRMDRVCLVYPDAEWELLLNTRRSYRNIRQKFSNRVICHLKEYFESLARLLRTLKLPVRMLDMHCFISFQQLQWILLEVPGLQHFSIRGYIDPQCETNEPFPVLTNLKCLKLRDLRSNQFDFFRMNVTNLQSLYMNCETDRELEEWSNLSGQLKVAHVYKLKASYFSQFIELTFPHLEDLTITDSQSVIRNEELASSRIHDFFRRHCLLRRLSVSVTIPVEWIRSITSHCSELTYLSLTYLLNPEEGILESLPQLTKLRHLKLDGKLDTKLFRGAIKSLESVELKMYPTRVLLENLFETVPQLSCLDIELIYNDSISIAFDFEFICEKFSCLRRLELDVRKQTLADNSVRIDRLEHLEELKIRNAKSISFIHRNNVRCLTIMFRVLRKRDLDEIPKKFPRLNRLTISCGYSVFASCFIRLHKLMPSCRIDYDSHRFYPQVYP